MRAARGQAAGLAALLLDPVAPAPVLGQAVQVAHPRRAVPLVAAPEAEAAAWASQAGRSCASQRPAPSPGRERAAAIRGAI